MNPALSQAVAAAIRQIGASATSLTSASRADALYEGFTFACVVDALAQLGARFEVRDYQDMRTATMVFRAKHGHIYSPGFTFVWVSLGRKEYELHADLRVLGRSNVLHELDVALLDRAECVRCRRGRVLPRQSKVKFLAECKFYGRSLPLHLGREFLGLSSEFGLRVKTMVSTVGSEGIKKMISSHGGTENFDVSPLNPANISMFVQWLAKELSQVLV